MKRSLIGGIILFIICISLSLYYEIKRDNYLNIYEITGKGLKTEKKDVYLNATFVAGSITNDKDTGFYVMFSDGVQYIVYMTNQKANRINNYLLDNPDNSYKINGMTKLIPKSLEENGKKFVKEWLDHNHNHQEGAGEEHDHNITTDDFYKYFGYVYLDNTVNSYLIVKIFIYLTGGVGALLIMQYVMKRFGL